MKSRFVIKPVSVKQVDKILEYMSIIGGESDNLGFGKEGVGLTLEYEVDFLSRKEEEEYPLMFGVWKRKRLVALGSISTNKTRSHLSHVGRLGISVRKEYWNKGIGTMLLAKLLEEAKMAGLEIVELEVRVGNDSGLSLYKKFGFIEVGRYKDKLKINGVYHDSIIIQCYL